MSGDRLAQITEWASRESRTPWADTESWSADYRRGYDQAIEEACSFLGLPYPAEPDTRRCTYRGCGRPEADPIHPGPNDRMGNGRHVYRHEPKR